MELPMPGQAGGGTPPPDARVGTYLQEMLALLRSDATLAEAVGRRLHDYGDTPPRRGHPPQPDAPAPGSHSHSSLETPAQRAQREQRDAATRQRQERYEAEERAREARHRRRRGNPPAGPPPTPGETAVEALSQGVADLAAGQTRSALWILRTVMRALAEFWTDRMDAEAESRAALSPPAPGATSSPPLPLKEAWGLLIRYRDTGKLPADAWPMVVHYTELRNDFVNVAEMAGAASRGAGGQTPAATPSGRQPGEGQQSGGQQATPAGQQGTPQSGGQQGTGTPAGQQGTQSGGQQGTGTPAGQQGTQSGGQQGTGTPAGQQGAQGGASSSGPPWRVPAPSLTGNARGDTRTQDWLFAGDDQQRWKTKQKQDLSLVASRAVCNQIAEMVAAARNVVLGGGITGDAAYQYDRSTNAEERAAQASSLLRLVPTRLLRPVERSEIRRGDLMFFMTWRQLGSVDEPWSIVSLRTPMDFLVAIYNPTDPIPAPPPPPGTPPPPRGPRPPPPPTVMIHPEPIVIMPRGHVFSNPSLRVVDESELVRGTTTRATRVDLTAHLYTHGEQNLGDQQLAVARTHFGQRESDPSGALGWMLVRRHPSVQRYHEVLVWAHMATVIDVPPRGDGLIAFETAEPTGVTHQSWQRDHVPHWHVVYARPEGRASEPSYLDHYLDRANVLDPGHLPEREDA
ncbi:MAG: hypothetical protein QM820_04430 [Minicystis sp.]